MHPKKGSKWPFAKPNRNPENGSRIYTAKPIQSFRTSPYHRFLGKKKTRQFQTSRYQHHRSYRTISTRGTPCSHIQIIPAISETVSINLIASSAPNQDGIIGKSSIRRPCEPMEYVGNHFCAPGQTKSPAAQSVLLTARSCHCSFGPEAESCKSAGQPDRQGTASAPRRDNRRRASFRFSRSPV